MAMYFCGIMANNWTYCRLMTSRSPTSMLRPNNDNGLIPKSLVDFSGRARVKTERSNPTILQSPAASHVVSFSPFSPSDFALLFSASRSLVCGVNEYSSR